VTLEICGKKMEKMRQCLGKMQIIEMKCVKFRQTMQHGKNAARFGKNANYRNEMRQI